MECVSLYVCMALLVCVRCQSVHSLSHLYISQIQKSFYGDLFLFFLLFYIYCSSIVVQLYLCLPTYPRQHTVMIIASMHKHGYMHAQLNGVQHSSIHFFKIVGRFSTQTLVSLQIKHKIFSQMMVVLTVTSHIKALGWLKKKKMKKEDEQFLILTISGRPPSLQQFLNTLSATVDWGSIHKLL